MTIERNEAVSVISTMTLTAIKYNWR